MELKLIGPGKAGLHEKLEFSMRTETVEDDAYGHYKPLAACLADVPFARVMDAHWDKPDPDVLPQVLENWKLQGLSSERRGRRALSRETPIARR